MTIIHYYYICKDLRGLWKRVQQVDTDVSTQDKKKCVFFFFYLFTFIFFHFVLFQLFLFYYIYFCFVIFILFYSFSFIYFTLFFILYVFILFYSILFILFILFILLLLGGSGDMPNSVNYKTFSSSEEFKKILEVQNIETFSPYLSIFILSFRLKLVDPIFPYYLHFSSLFICTLFIASLFILFLFYSFDIIYSYFDTFFIFSHLISLPLLISYHSFSIHLISSHSYSPVLLQEDEFTPLIVGYFDETTNSADKSIFEEVRMLLCDHIFVVSSNHTFHSSFLFSLPSSPFLPTSLDSSISHSQCISISLSMYLYLTLCVSNHLFIFPSLFSFLLPLSPLFSCLFLSSPFFLLDPSPINSSLLLSSPLFSSFLSLPLFFHHTRWLTLTHPNIALLSQQPRESWRS